MNQIVSTKVPFSATNVGKCMCPKCPVQSKSQCVSGKLVTINQALSKSPLTREDIPGQYCSTGGATCTDLDSKQSCICPTCSVFSQYGLVSNEPTGYYCRDGFAR